MSNDEMDWRQVLRDFWRDFSAAIGDTKELRTTEVLDNLNEVLAPLVFPPKADGSDPRGCPVCGDGRLSLKLGKFGSFVGCSNYPECKFTRTLSADPDAPPIGDAEKPGQRSLGTDLESGLEVTLRDGRFGPYLQLGEGEKPKRSSLPKGLKPADVDLETALTLLSLPRPVAKHPASGEPILAGIGRYGPYVQHGRTYANLDDADDVLTIGGNRAIDLIVAKEEGRGGRRGGGAVSGTVLGDHPDGGPVTVRAGRFGPYVNAGKVNATLPKGTDPATLTLDEALRLIAAKAEQTGLSPSTKKAPARKAAAGTSKVAAKAPIAKAPAAKTSAKAPAKRKSGVTGLKKTA